MASTAVKATEFIEKDAISLAQDIYSRALQCQKLFVEYLKRPRAYRKQMSDLQHRFLTWASFLGVFANVNASLDARLWREPETKELVLTMLRVLMRNLERGEQHKFHLGLSKYGRFLTTANLAIRQHVIVNPQSSDIDGKDQDTENTDGAMYGMTGAMDRLHRLAAAIRQSPRTDEVERVLNFARKQKPDGFFTTILAMVQFLFPDAEKSLQTQLTESIVYRRHRLLWSRKHSQKLGHQRKDEEASETVKERTRNSGLVLHHRDVLPSAAAGSNYSSTIPSLWPLSGIKNKPHQRVQLESGQDDTASGRSSNPPPTFQYPDVPQILAGESKLHCKYCLTEIEIGLNTSDEGKQKIWRKHIDADIQPFVCCSEECGKFPPVFSGIKNWKKHMQESHRADWAQYIHRIRWPCPYCVDPVKPFLTEELFVRHLKDVSVTGHPTVLDTIDLAKIIAKTKLSNPRPAGNCPLCGPPPWNDQTEMGKWTVASSGQPNTPSKLPNTSSEPPDISARQDDTLGEEPRASSGKPDNLAAHFTNHLRYLAFLSLRWWDDETRATGDIADGGGESDDAIGFISEGRTDPKTTKRTENSPLIELNDFEIHEKQREDEILQGIRFDKFVESLGSFQPQLLAGKQSRAPEDERLKLVSGVVFELPYIVDKMALDQQHIVYKLAVDQKWHEVRQEKPKVEPVFLPRRRMGCCDVIAAKLRIELRKNELNLHHKPDDAPREFITPTNVKAILKTGPIEQLFLCSCINCENYSGCVVDDRRVRYEEDELTDAYATIFALLLTENCPGLIHEFQKRRITLDRRLYKEQIGFLKPILIERFNDETIAVELEYRILANQFKFYAQPFEIRNVEMEIEPHEALPIDEEERPMGEGSSAEVFAFKILEEYKGNGYKDLKIQKFARKVFRSKKQSSGLGEWCRLVQIHDLIEKPHPHIVEIFGAFQYGETFSIISPLAEHSLEGYFQSEKSFTSDYVWAQMQGLAAGLAYLHGLRGDVVDDTKGKQKTNYNYIIIAYHLDLKPENILIVNAKFQIADFGLSTIKNKLAIKSYDSDSDDSWNRGYMIYSPPELLTSKREHYAAHDLWSLGAIFSEMATHDLHPTSKAYRSIYQYRKNRQLDTQGYGFGSRCFHNQTELKEAVRSQHRALLDAALKNSDNADQLWQRNFYPKFFFELISRMLDMDPTKRGTADQAAKTLEHLRTDTNERQKSPSHARRVDQWTPSFKTVWEQVDRGELQRAYEIWPETLYLKAYWQIRGSDPRLCECVAFFDGLENGEDLSIRVIRHLQPEIEKPNMTEKLFIVNRDMQNIDSRMIPLYATKPTEETTRQHDRSGITIFGRQFEETFYFDHLQEAYDFQRLLIQQYAVSRFYKISEVTLIPKLFQSSRTINNGDIFLQLWSNHDLSDSGRPRYEDRRHIARVAILASDQLYLVRIWNGFELPAAADSGHEMNPVTLKPNHGDLNTLRIKTGNTTSRSNSVSHSIPIPPNAPEGYDTKFKKISIKFTTDSDIPDFWRALETLQRGPAAT